MTLVGDPGQASQPGAVATWDDVLALVPTHNPPNFVTLSVNYRTPAEVMDVASRLLAVAAPTIEPSHSVRATGEQPRFISVASDSLITETVAAVREAVARTGTIAVIAPTELHAVARRCPRRIRRGYGCGRSARCRGRGARRNCRKGSRVRPRRRRGAEPLGHTRSRPGCGCCTSRSHGRPSRSRSCTRNRCPRDSGRITRSLRERASRSGYPAEQRAGPERPGRSDRRGAEPGVDPASGSTA